MGLLEPVMRVRLKGLIKSVFALGWNAALTNDLGESRELKAEAARRQQKIIDLIEIELELMRSYPHGE